MELLRAYYVIVAVSAGNLQATTTDKENREQGKIDLENKILRQKIKLMKSTGKKPVNFYRGILVYNFSLISICSSFF